MICRMAMCVTEKMVDAAWRQVPGVANRVRVRRAIEAAVAEAPDEPRITENGIEGPGVTEPTGQPSITVNYPRVYAGVAEIAARLQAGRSTVAGWVKNAAANGMPAPVAVLAAGPVYDLEAVEAWYRAWKGGA